MRLQLISEGTTAVPPDERSGHSKHGSGWRPPPGTHYNQVLATLSGTHDDESLYLSYLAKFIEAQREGDLARTERLCSLAERDYDERRRLRPRVREDEKERNKRIVITYVGRPAIEVADYERLPVSVIHKVRGEHGREPHTGHPAIGLTQIGAILGVTKQRAHQLAESEGFPAPIPGATRAGGRLWARESVEAWATKFRQASCAA